MVLYISGSYLIPNLVVLSSYNIPIALCIPPKWLWKNLLKVKNLKVVFSLLITKWSFKPMVSITKPKNMVQMPEIEAESNNEAEEEKNGVGS